MSDIIESIRQGAGQVLDEFDQKGQIKSTLQGIRLQLGELERRRRSSGLEGQIKTLQGESKQLTEALGLQTLSLFELGKIDHPELSHLCRRVSELRAEIEQKKADLAALKASAAPAQSRCAQCQTEVSADAEFCPKCGAELRTLAAETPAPPAAGQRTVVRLRCPKCKTVLPPKAGFCPTCGVKIKQPQAHPARKQFCASCGAQMQPGARFCPLCGKPASSTP
jgi:RNA polymerase subunit RPABC4/transcription elongation factor Spt4